MRNMRAWGAALGGLAVWAIATPGCEVETVSGPPACAQDSECDDGDDCTEDECAGTGTKSCTHTLLGTPECAGSCAASTDCDDGDACTTDECTDGLCVNLLDEACCTDDGTCDAAEPCTCADCIREPACASTCNEDAQCDDGEACDCSDCASLETCGAGCMPFTIVDAPSASFLDATPSALGEALADYFQGFGLTTPGTYDLSPPGNLVDDCMGPTPCIQVNVDGTDFYSATSGTMELTGVDPIEAVFSNVVFHPRTVDANNDVTVDLEGQCLYLAQGLVPTR